MSLRGGMWAVVFTDLVDSTAQRARVGDAVADDLRREHDAIVLRATAKSFGHVIKSTGDGSMAVFAGAADAVDAAIVVQQGVELRNRTSEEHLALRVGISLGDLVYENDDLFGMAVNEAARLCALAGPGEVLLSDLVRAVGGSRLQGELIDWGHHVLKGFPEPARVWAAIWEPAAEPDRIGLPAVLGSIDAAMPFSGRASELDVLLDIWKISASGNRQMVLISGEPGIGKTRLATETARLAHDAGALVLYGHCDEDGAVPFQPFTEVIDWYFEVAEADVVEGKSPAELGRLSLRARETVAIPPDRPASDADTAQYRLFDAVGSWFADLSRQQPIVFIIDDMHWASKPTLLLLKHLLRVSPDAALLVVGTYRDTDLDREHPLGSMLADLGRLAGSTRIALSGLDDGAVDELLADHANRPLDADARALSRALQVETRGNAFFIGEILHHLSDRGLLMPDVSWAQARAVASDGIPQGVKAILGERLDRLGDSATDVLRAAAVAGRDFDAPLAIAGSGLSHDVVLDALDRALTARLVEDIGRGSYRFSHALVRAALLDELSSARRMRLHHRVALALESLRPDDYPALAHHWCEAAAAGDPKRAIEVSRIAATRARERAAFAEAVALLERAVDVTTGAAADPMLTAQLLLDLGDARMAAAAVDAARMAYLAAVETSGDARDVLVHAALSFEGPPQLETVDERHEPLVLRALDGLDPIGEPDLCAQLHAALALRIVHTDPRKYEHLARAVELASGSEDPRTRYDVGRARYWLSFTPHGEALSEAQRVLQAARELESTSEQLAALVFCMIAASQRGGDNAAREYAVEFRRLTSESHLPHFRDTTTGLDARMQISAGNHEAAMSLAQQALDALPDEANTLSWASVAAQQLRLTDRHAALARSLQDWVGADLIPEEVRLYVDASLALALADDGRQGEARSVFEKAAADGFARLAPEGAPGRPAELALLASACVAISNSAHAATLLQLLQPWTGEHLAMTMGEYCGPAALFVGRLQHTCGLLDDAVLSFEQAIAEANAGGSPLKIAEARLDLARTLFARNDADDWTHARSLLSTVRQFGLGHSIPYLSRPAETLDAEMQVN